MAQTRLTQTDTAAMPDPETDVLIVGAGPTGLTLAAALTARGVRTTVIDRLPEGANTSRAAVVHARTLEVLEALEVSERLAGLACMPGASQSATAIACSCRSISATCLPAIRTR